VTAFAHSNHRIGVRALGSEQTDRAPHLVAPRKSSPARWTLHRGGHRPSRFPSRESVFAGRNFSVRDLREHAGLHREQGPEETLAPAAKPRFGPISLYLPCGSGISSERRVRTGRSAPPLSLLLQRISRRSASRRPASPQADHRLVPSAQAGPTCRQVLCCQVGRFAFAPDSPLRESCSADIDACGTRPADWRREGMRM
jgi:hypothetical protein